MTALNIYFSTNTPQEDRPYSAIAVDTTGGTAGSLNQGYDVGVTSVRAADTLELRIMLYTTGTTNAGLVKKDIMQFLELCKKWVREQGQNANGLDAVIQAAITNTNATAATAAIP